VDGRLLSPDTAGFERRAAMALVSELVRSDLPAGAKAALLLDWDRVLGLDLARGAPVSGELPPGAADLLAKREAARAAKDFATSDRLRDELAALGVHVTDTPTGQAWRT